MVITEINVLDEVLSSEPLYEIKDETGKVVATNCTIEMITSVLQNGTPINKKLFDDINNNFQEIKKEFRLRKKSSLEFYFGV